MKEKIILNISRDFTDAPGARYYKDGPKSGQEFYEELLKSKFEEAFSKKTRLFVDLDDSWGYPSSFISASFGRLSHEFGSTSVLEHLELKSDDDKELISLIKQEIQEPTYTEAP